MISVKLATNIRKSESRNCYEVFKVRD